MFYYVYKVTNKINNKYYIGKHKNNKPYDNSYMGSGKLIIAAINKYGKDSFTKEILAIFDTDEEAAKFEQFLVTKDEVSSNQCYNMHEGGSGGFAHINSLHPNERPNLITIKEKVRNGELSLGGTKNWTDESRIKILAGGLKGSKIGIVKAQSQEAIEKRTKTQKENKHQQGENNSQFGKRVFIDPITNNKIKVFPEEQPLGYKLYSEYKEEKLQNSRRWYNDGVINFRLKSTDEKVLNLIKGRIKTA